MEKEKVDLLRDKIIKELEQSNLYFHVKNKFYKMVNTHHNDFYQFIDGIDEISDLPMEDMQDIKLNLIYFENENIPKNDEGLFEGRMKIVIENKKTNKKKLFK